MLSQLLDQLRKDEGEVKQSGRHVAYLDHLDLLTLGYGRLIDERRGGGLSDEEAEYLLRNDVNQIISQVSEYPWFQTLSEPRRAVIVMMAFQLGVNGMLSFKKMIEGIQARDYGKAAAEMLDSIWASEEQTPLRAKRLAIQMDSGEWQNG